MTRRRVAIIAGIFAAFFFVTAVALGYADAFTDSQPWDARLDDLATIHFGLLWLAGSVAAVAGVGS